MGRKQSGNSRLGDTLAAKNEGKRTEKTLVFDPETGELVVKESHELTHPDATTVDQIATDGFAG